jgi:hypothetical protein
VQGPHINTTSDAGQYFKAPGGFAKSPNQLPVAAFSVPGKSVPGYETGMILERNEGGLIADGLEKQGAEDSRVEGVASGVEEVEELVEELVGGVEAAV